MVSLKFINSIRCSFMLRHPKMQVFGSAEERFAQDDSLFFDMNFRLGTLGFKSDSVLCDWRQRRFLLSYAAAEP